MKYMLVCMLLLIETGLRAQTTPVLEENGVYLSDSEFLQHHLLDGFSNGKGHKLNDNKKDFLIVQTAELRDTFYFDRIWGFRKGGADWRVYRNEYYQVSFVNDKICLYDVPGTGQSEGIRTMHYFSVSASGRVYHLTKHNLELAYRDNVGFVEKMKSGHSVFKWDRPNKNYLFVSWL
jgi:hypothetical protein